MFQILWWTPWNFHGILWARRRGPLAAATRSIIRRVVHTTADSCMQEFGQGVHQIVPHNSLYRPNDMHREFPRDLKDMQFQRWLSVKEFWKSVVIWLNLNPWNNYFLRSIIFTDFYGCATDHEEQLSFWSHVQIRNGWEVKIAKQRPVKWMASTG